MFVIVFAPIGHGYTKKKKKRNKERKKIYIYSHMLRAEEFTSRHEVTLGDKGSGRNAFYPPSLEFWILVPFYLFPPFFLAPFFRAISFPPFQPTIASRATDNVISICIYVPTVPSTGFFYTVIHTRYHFANWFLSPIRDEPILPRILRSFPFISLSLSSPFPFVRLIRRNVNCELWKK